MSATGVFPAITASIGGKQRRLTLEKQWRRAIEKSEIDRSTAVHYEAGPGLGQMKAAGDCPELIALFDEIKGPLPLPESEQEPVAEQRNVESRIAEIESEIDAAESESFTASTLSSDVVDTVRLATPAQRNATPARTPPPSGQPTHAPSTSPVEWGFMPLNRYAEFSGRSCRSEYWFHFLIIQLPVSLFGLLAIGTESEFWLAIVVLTCLGLFIPSLAVSVRRFHDRDMSGWMVLLFLLGTLIPFIGFFVYIAYIVILALPGTSGVNRYGPDPVAP